MTQLYFAYGSNMDARQMARRCPGATATGKATMAGWQFIINERGYATVVPKEGALVHGVLWELSPEHEATLDVYEAVAEGLYTKEYITMKQWDGGECTPLIYLATHTQHGPPRPGYLEKILHGAEAFGLPADYVEELAGWAKVKGVKAW